MGAPMARHLLEAGYPVSLFNRTPQRAAPLIKSGATWCDSPSAVAEASDVVFTIVGYPNDVRHVWAGEQGLLSGSRPGQVFVDMTTSSPQLAEELAESAARRGISALDAPVSGGDVGARQGTLSIMVGGKHAAFEQLQPLWQCLGKTIVHHGPPGSGQHAKLVNQTIVAGNMIGLCEALLYAQQAGLQLERVLQSISQGAASSWALQNLAPRLLNMDLQPGFFVQHFVKDMGLVLAEAERMRLVLPGLSLVKQLYTSVLSHGGATLGTQALVIALAEMSNTTWRGLSPASDA
jgi:3-hydroxyisobutyrate dehydrogenase